MKGVFTLLGIIVGAVLVGALAPSLSRAAEEAKQAAIVAGELSAIANQLQLRPETAIDFTKVSGEYCFDVHITQGGHMHHHAVDPTKTQEDVIDFVNAEPLIKAGIPVDRLPRFPGGLNSMTPNQWYFLPAGEQDPHHGFKWPFPVLMRAADLK